MKTGKKSVLIRKPVIPGDIFMRWYCYPIIMMPRNMVIYSVCLIFALVSVVGANSYYLYGYEGHIYGSYVTFSKENVYTYFLDSPSSADFDLIVYDTYDGKVYKSQKDGNVQETVRVPGTPGYKHVIFIDGFSGEGPFNLFTANDSVTWENNSFTDLGEYFFDEEATEMVDDYYNEILNLSPDGTS